MRGGDKVTTVEEHDEWIVESCNRVLNKNDVLWVLGDIAFDMKSLKHLGRIKGQKHLILGNHDNLPVSYYSEYGSVYPGLTRYKSFWLSHCPIHPDELRGRLNIHGHVHSNSINDERYINVCMEQLYDGEPVSLTELKRLREMINKV